MTNTDFVDVQTRTNFFFLMHLNEIKKIKHVPLP